MSSVPSQHQRVLSGMRPTGRLHLGHYHGVLKNWIRLQHEYECFFFVADWHALTTHYDDPSIVGESVWDMVVDWLAAGIDPGDACLFIQSRVPEHAELHLLLSMVIPVSWLERVPSYKEQQQQLGSRDLSTYGFLGYPLLQAADIIIYKADAVPVGEDQAPHVEMTREVVRRFNHMYGANTFPEPKTLLTETPRTPGTDGRKMSKSYNNSIYFKDDADTIRKRLRTMVTDPARKRRTDPGDPAQCPVFDLHKVFSTQETQDWAAEGCRSAGIGCIECKNALADKVVVQLEPIRKRRQEFERRPDDVRAIYRDGARRAREVATATMVDVRNAVQLLTEEEL